MSARERVTDLIPFAEAVQSGYGHGPEEAVAALVAETYRQAAADLDRSCTVGDVYLRHAANFLRRRAAEIEHAAVENLRRCANQIEKDQP